MLSNPSGIFSICINEIFSDSESIHRSLRRQLPFCIDPYTKYPLNFNIYVTSFKNREIIKAAIFVNATVRYEGEDVITRLWLQEVKFNLMHNHLRMQGLEFKGCKADYHIVSIKNYFKHDEISELNILVNMLLDFAELQANRNNGMTMKDWVSKLNDYVCYNRTVHLVTITKLSSVCSWCCSVSYADESNEYNGPFMLPSFCPSCIVLCITPPPLPTRIIVF